MRVFWAVFYLLFFNLTVFAQTGRTADSHAMEPKVQVTGCVSWRAPGHIQIARQVAAASSLRVAVDI